jgi:hypothetical protein
MHRRRAEQGGRSGLLEGKAMREDRERGEGEERGEAYQRRSDELDSPFPLISFHFNLCSIKETKLFLREVKSKEQSTAQHSTVKERKFKERKMISIIVS